MPTLLLSDFHGENPVPFIREKINEGIDKLVTLGDYDHPDILEEILGLEIEKITGIGNHDYSIVKGEYFESGLLNYGLEYLRKWWLSSEKAWDFVTKSMAIGEKAPGRKKGMKIVERIDGKKVVYVHGALVSHDSSDKLVWGRIRTNGARMDNFKEMQKKGYWALFKGHEHTASAFSIKEGESPYSAGIREEGKEFQLEQGRIYIITLAGFYDGKYAILDDRLNFSFKSA